MSVWEAVDIGAYHRQQAEYAMRCALLVSNDPLLRACVTKLLAGEGWTPHIAKAWALRSDKWAEQVLSAGLTLPS